MDLPTKEIVNALKAVGKHVTGWQTDDGHVLVTALSKTRAAACPGCACWSNRIHDRSVRHLAERPCLNLAVTIELQVHRFKCSNPGCSRRTFVERLDPLARSYQRRTQSHARALQAIGFALGGRQLLASPTNSDSARAGKQSCANCTVLRRARASRYPHGSSGSTTGRLPKGTATAPSWLTSSAAARSSFSSAEKRPQLLLGFASIQRWRSWPETVPARTPRPSSLLGPRPRRSPIGGTCSTICARASSECSIA